MIYFILALIAIFLIYHGWKAWIDPAAQLGRQGANMNWVTSRYINMDGARHQCLKRGSLEAMIDFNKKVVHLLLPDTQKTFNDFVELENWLGEAKATATSKSEFMNQISKDGEVLQNFIAELGNWPESQAQAATDIVTSVLEKSEKNLDPYFDKLTLAQIKAVSDVISKLTGTKPPSST